MFLIELISHLLPLSAASIKPAGMAQDYREAACYALIDYYRPYKKVIGKACDDRGRRLMLIHEVVRQVSMMPPSGAEPYPVIGLLPVRQSR